MEVKNYFVHETSTLEENVNIGKASKIWRYCHVRKNVQIGKNVTIGRNVFIDSGVTIGNNCKIGNNVSIFTGVTIRNDVFIGPSVTFTNDLYPQVNKWDESMVIQTLIDDGVSIGANSTIICGVTISSHSLIGAGSVVTKDIPKNKLAFGNPAKIMRDYKKL